MPTPEHFAHLFDYEFRCTDLVIASIRAARRSVEDTGLASLAAPLERGIAIFCHMQAARRVWLHRIAPSLTPFPPDGLFPIWPLEQAEIDARQVDGLWRNYIAALARKDGPSLSSAVPYTSTEGAKYESTLADILTHVVNHSTYHRGQIANMVAAAGAKPSVTDFIALTRKKV